MNSAAAIIEALNARSTPIVRLRQSSWTAWLNRVAQTPGRVTGAPADDLVAELALRELASPPPRAIALNRWRAFSTLWRQQWHPASRDERRWRWTAGGVSLVWHVVIAILLLVLTALRFELPPRAEDTAVQIEYIGDGTPAEQGGGPAPSPAAQQADESPARAAAAAASAAATAASATSEATPTPATAPQPLTTSTPVSPEAPTFTLPPTTPPTPDLQLQRANVPELQVVDIPRLDPAPGVTLPTPRIDVRAPAADAPAIVEREITAAPKSPAFDAKIDVRVDVPRAAAQPVEVRTRDVPMASASASSSSASSSNASPSASSANLANGTSRAAGPSNARPSNGVGIGPSATPAPGSWATPKRGDDWGDSTRNRPGTVFGGDGRPKLADGPGSASAGHPPGEITNEIKDIDRVGTWLRRKPLPYEPTRWDRVWKPNQVLLQDWVDKGVKQVGIPIPGTNKRIVCIISILQLGGGCGVSDPNLNDQPATARPPPPVPFKPALQEGNGATQGSGAPMPPLPGMFAPPKTGVPPGTTPTPVPNATPPPA